MSPHLRRLWRCAERAYARYARPAPLAPDGTPATRCAELLTLARRTSRARRHGLPLAALRLQGEFQERLRRLATPLEDVRPPHRRPSLGELFEDLRALEQEFPSFVADPKRGTLLATTEPIVLEEHDLGGFEVRLELGSLPLGRPSYTVEPADPHAGFPRHPHLSGGLLCEGEGAGPIRAALTEGRLFDFFCVVRQVLSTYNRASAYVPLDHHSGPLCRDCGCLVEEEEGGPCERCDGVVCDDCGSGCERCGRGLCGGCSALCRVCDGVCCGGCLEACRLCEQPTCDSCLEEGACENCAHQNRETAGENPAGEASPAAETAADAAAHPVRDGEAVVPA